MPDFLILLNTGLPIKTPSKILNRMPQAEENQLNLYMPLYLPFYQANSKLCFYLVWERENQEALSSPLILRMLSPFMSTV